MYDQLANSKHIIISVLAVLTACLQIVSHSRHFTWVDGDREDQELAGMKDKSSSVNPKGGGMARRRILVVYLIVGFQLFWGRQLCAMSSVWVNVGNDGRMFLVCEVGAERFEKE